MISKLLSRMKTMLNSKVVEPPVVEVFSVTVPVTLPLSTSGAMQKPLFRLEITAEALTEKELIEQVYSIYCRYLGTGPKPTGLLSHDSESHSWSSKFSHIE